MARQWRSVGRDIPTIEKGSIYGVEIKPWSINAPTYINESYGEKDARVANFLTGEATKRVVDAFAKSQYGKHYEVVLQEYDSRNSFYKGIAQRNASNIKELYDKAIRKVASFYKNDMYKQWGSEYDYQPKGGLTSNSTH